MKKAFTMIEIIITIVIMGILSVGTLVSIKHLYIRAAKTNAINSLSLNSEVALNQISALLYKRVASSVIGYNPKDKNFKSIYDIDNNFTILEWIGLSKESLKAKCYSGFIDLDSSDRKANTAVSFDLNVTSIDEILRDKFGGELNVSKSDIALIFAGSFDSGNIVSSDEFNNSFGWYGNKHNITYDVNITENNISFGTVKPKEIYEKYYLVDSAYAIARGEDINISSTCIKNFNISKDDINNTLFLFYNYRPWKGETFCADPQTVINGKTALKEGNVTILLNDCRGFEAGLVNDSIYFDLTLSKNIRGSDNTVTISKQKVVF